MSRAVRPPTFRANLNAEYIPNSPLSSHFVQVICNMDKFKGTEVPNLEIVESNNELRQVPDIHFKSDKSYEKIKKRNEKEIDQLVP